MSAHQIAGMLAVGLAAWLGVAGGPADGQALSGADLYQANCQGCHELYDPESPRRSRAEWDAILTKMIQEQGAALSVRERAAVLAFLDSFNRPPREILWRESAAASRVVEFAAPEEASPPPEWVELTLGSDEVIPWGIAPASTGGGVAPLRRASEGRLPALVDNSGVVRDGAVTARMRLSSPAGGGGVLIGYRSPRSFYGVRVGARDVILFETQGDRRARLARVVRETPVGEWVTLVVQIRNGEARVRLNDQALPGLTRTLPAYHAAGGGWAGLHTQSNGGASFNRWETRLP
jgi:hypothetical protein